MTIGSDSLTQTARCQQQAAFRYTWPGRDERFICLEHARQLRNVATTVGLYVQLIPLSEDEQAQASCSQNL